MIELNRPNAILTGKKRIKFSVTNNLLKHF
jgi:hypothetical protein